MIVKVKPKISGMISRKRRVLYSCDNIFNSAMIEHALTMGKFAIYELENLLMWNRDGQKSTDRLISYVTECPKGEEKFETYSDIDWIKKVNEIFWKKLGPIHGEKSIEEINRFFLNIIGSRPLNKFNWCFNEIGQNLSADAEALFTLANPVCTTYIERKLQGKKINKQIIALRYKEAMIVCWSYFTKVVAEFLHEIIASRHGSIGNHLKFTKHLQKYGSIGGYRANGIIDRFVDSLILDLFQISNKKLSFEPRKDVEIAVTIGMDPEFELYRAKKCTKTGELTPDLQKGFVRANEAIKNPSQQLGTDANARIAEIRPRHSKHPEIVAENVGKILKKLSQKVSTYSKTPIVPIAGGGFLQSTGGHIHFGHPLFRALSEYGGFRTFGKILDNFLYYPIRKNMPFSARSWVRNGEIKKAYSYGNNFENIPREIYSRGDTIMRVGKNTGKMRLYGYDKPSQFREQDYGIEYRSLPSFIIDYDFTKIVLKIAKGIASEFLEKLSSEGTIEFSSPPEEKDYLRYITKDEYKLWNSYLYGKRKNIVTKNMFANWKIDATCEQNNLLILMSDSAQLADFFATTWGEDIANEITDNIMAPFSTWIEKFSYDPDKNANVFLPSKPSVIIRAFSNPWTSPKYTFYSNMVVFFGDDRVALFNGPLLEPESINSVTEKENKIIKEIEPARGLFKSALKSLKDYIGGDNNTSVYLLDYDDYDKLSDMIQSLYSMVSLAVEHNRDFFATTENCCEIDEENRQKIKEQKDKIVYALRKRVKYALYCWAKEYLPDWNIAVKELMKIEKYLPMTVHNKRYQITYQNIADYCDRMSRRKLSRRTIKVLDTPMQALATEYCETIDEEIRGGYATTTSTFIGENYSVPEVQTAPCLVNANWQIETARNDADEIARFIETGAAPLIETGEEEDDDYGDNEEEE